MPNGIQCDLCTEKCPQAARAREAASGRMYATKEFIALQKKVESGQLVEVVRCKDCVHVTNICLRNGAVLYKCNRFYEQYGADYGTWDGPAPVMPPDGFCSDGKRRCE